MINYNIIYLYLFLSVSFLFPYATITGKVYDSNSNEPLIGVNVILLETSRALETNKRTISVQVNTDYGSSTDVEGEFIIKNISLGEYTLKAMYIGYQNKEMTVTLDEDISYTFDIKLDVGEIALDETTVTAVYEREEKKTEAPATIETVTSKEIEQATTSNLGSYLQGLKGVDFTASGVNNYSLSIRGFNSSFSTRLLMLTDGRPANVPSLRVVNFSTVPLISDDIEKIEVVLGPATALYGANAHSGVINIISKAPSLSEGFSGSFAGTFDDRNLKKFSGRYAKKINDKLSFKISGSHFSAYEWPYISESEYRAHKNPWVGFPGRLKDGDDNNPSSRNFIGGISPASSNTVRWAKSAQGTMVSTEHSGNGWPGAERPPESIPEGMYYVLLGNGEPNHGDMDGDGFAGEDWINGIDDDGDGEIDEDYWWADGVDNFEPWEDLDGDNIFDFEDLNGNNKHDGPEPFFDINNNGTWDEGEWWQDLLGDAYTSGQWDAGEPTYESWTDWDMDGSYDGTNNVIDENIDEPSDEWLDGVDNNGNGIVDEDSERYTTDEIPSQWALAIDNKNILITYGRLNKYLMDGSGNQWYIENTVDDHLRGKSRWSEDLETMEFDVFEWDFGEDGVAADYHYEYHGDGILNPGEPGTLNGFDDFGLDGYKYYEELDPNGEGHYAAQYCISPSCLDEYGVGTFIYITDINGDLIWLTGPDEGEGDGIWQPGDTWFDADQDWQVDEGESGWSFSFNEDGHFQFLTHTVGVDDGGMPGVIDDCFPGYWGINVFTGEMGWNGLSYGTNINDTQMEIDANGYVLNCYGICPNESSIYYDETCVTNESIFSNYEVSSSTEDWRFYQTRPFDYNEIEVSSNVVYDVWPPPDNIFNQNNDIIDDCGQDGYCWDFDGNQTQQHATDIWGNFIYEDSGDPLMIYGPDYGEGNGTLDIFDSGEFDGTYDTSDGIYNVKPEPFEDLNNDGIWNQNEPYTDTDGNGYYTIGDWHPNFVQVNDTNGDGLDDYPDFEVINDKVEIRLDYDPSSDLNISLQSGYAFTKTQQVTGVGRYLADGWKSNYIQLRGRYKQWFMQGFLNTNDAGKTRGYNRGDLITDQSSNYGFQIQNVFDISKYHTEVTWGIDYMKTLPFTDGSVLNDGPNGFDDDEDQDSYVWDFIDHAQDGDGVVYGDEDDRAFGIDEDDEFTTNILSNELGFYFQSKTDLFNNSRWEMITSARVDYHDQLKEEGLLFGPKFGLTYKPSELTTWRMGYGKAYNTPTITALHTNLIFGRWGEHFTMILKGNKDGTPYARADNTGELGEWGFETNLIDPFYYELDDEGNYMVDPITGEYQTISFHSSGLDDCVYDPNNPCDPYLQRIQGAPMFFNTGDGTYPTDYIALDTLNHHIFIPSAYDDGVNYTKEESVNLSDVDPLRSESMRTLEFGVSSFVTQKSLFTTEIYFTRYNDFFSPATFITPLVKDNGGNVIGLIPSNLDRTYAPYGTAWDGLDNDNDWSGLGYFVDQSDIVCVDEFGAPTGDPYPCGIVQNEGRYLLDYDHLQNMIQGAELQDWSDLFGWDDDKNGDNDPRDVGEWGYVDRLCQDGYECDIEDGHFIYTIIHPHQIWYSDPDLDISNTFMPQKFDEIDGRWLDVGVDEFSSLAGNYFEAEIIDEETGKKGFPDKLPIITLSSLNYGTVYHSGMDIGFTHFFNQKFVVDMNLTLFNSTDYFNELTRRYDPINAPKFKFNIAANLDTKVGNFMFKLRHVDKFEWADGTWAGEIGPYNIFDLHYIYDITKNLKIGVTANNLFDDKHRELIGGAKMGRQVIIRLTTLF